MPYWHKRLNVSGDYVEVRRVPSDTHVARKHPSKDKVLGIRVFFALSFGTPLYNATRYKNKI